MTIDHSTTPSASEVGGIPDMIGDESGILVSAGDRSALAEAMDRLPPYDGLIREGTIPKNSSRQR